MPIPGGRGKLALDILALNDLLANARHTETILASQKKLLQKP